MMTLAAATRLSNDMAAYVQNMARFKPILHKQGYAIRVMDFANSGQYYVAFTCGPILGTFDSRERWEEEKMTLV